MTKKKRSKREVLTEVPDEITLDMLECRLFGHEWERFNPIGMKPPFAGWRLSLRCVRCTSQRHDLISIIGFLVQREYRYPANYEVSGILTVDVKRIELRRRARGGAQGHPFIGVVESRESSRD